MDKSVIQTLLMDTITTICQNSINYDMEMRIEGMLVITIDQSEVMTLKVNEHMNRDTLADPADDDHEAFLNKRKRKLDVDGQNRKLSTTAQKTLKSSLSSNRQSLQQITQDDLFNDGHSTISQSQYGDDQNSTPFARHFLQMEGVALAAGGATGFPPTSQADGTNPSYGIGELDSANSATTALQKSLFESSPILPLLKPMTPYEVYTSNSILDKGPLDSVSSLLAMCDRLLDETYWKQTYRYMQKQSGKNTGDSVRRMMRKLGTCNLWSKYSLKGRKNKLCFLELPICDLLIRVTLDVHRKEKAQKVEEEISNVLKYSPTYIQRRKGPGVLGGSIEPLPPASTLPQVSLPQVSLPQAPVTSGHSVSSSNMHPGGQTHPHPGPSHEAMQIKDPI